MKTLARYIVVFLMLSNYIHGQDQLFKKDNTKLLVKVIEISPDEVKYKLFSNLNGPAYVESRNNVTLIIYENGTHQVMDSAPSSPTYSTSRDPYQPMKKPTLEKFDSAKYYKYSESIQVNFLTFMNSELGLIYQKEIYRKHLAIIIPVAVGVAPPGITQSVYFNDNFRKYQLNRKLFEVGLGINYYPSFRTNVNYYIGPCVRYMQYDGTQTYFNPFQPRGILTTHKSTLTRYCVSITNGLIFRTRSRLVTNIFGSLGFKSDAVSSMPDDPYTQGKINPISKPVNLYFWGGFAVGYSF